MQLYSPNDTCVDMPDPAGASAGPGDPLDALLHLEQAFFAEGVAAAAEASAVAGAQDGRALGWASGAALAAELEFCHGGAQAILALVGAHPGLIRGSAVVAAEKLVAAVGKARLAVVGNDPALDMEELARQVRGLFRQTVAFAGLPAVRYAAGPRSRMADYSF